MRALISCFIKEGNLTGIAVALVLLIGFSTLVASLYFFENQNFRVIGASIGLAIASIGGYGARAKTLGLKPFDNSYKRSRASYDSDDQTANQFDEKK